MYPSFPLVLGPATGSTGAVRGDKPGLPAQNTPGQHPTVTGEFVAVWVQHLDP